MRSPSDYSFLIGSLALVLLLTCVSASQAVEQITCASDKGVWTHFELSNADQLDVRLVKQLSRSKCEQGVSWGVDGEGIWVDKGCRAVFEHSQGVQAAAPQSEKTGIFSPDAGILCDRKVGFCYDAHGASLDLTRTVFGEKAAGKLAGTMQNVGLIGGDNVFTLSNGVTCYPKERACKERRCEEILNRNYTELLFGRDQEEQ